MADDAADARQEPDWSEDSGDVVLEGSQTPAQHSDSNDQNQHLEATSAAYGDTEDAADYDPESIPVLATGSDSETLKPSPQPASKKRRTAAGFLVGDSDDSEDDDDRSPSPGSKSPEPEVEANPAQPSPSLMHAPPAQHANGAAQSNAPPHPDSPILARSGAALSNSPAQGNASAEPAAVLYDRVALFELRVKEDPRGALDAWQSLFAEYRQRNNSDEWRDAYERFLAVFPHSAEIWAQYAQTELAMGNFVEAEAIFNKSLLAVPNVELWTIYLDYIRRRNDLNDPTGKARQVLNQAYDFVLDNVGMDKEAGRLWSDYIQFIRLAPGTIGGPNWQDKQKMDQLRKAFQRAVCIPISNVNMLWKEYDQFEKGVNPATSRKFLNEHSPAYMTAKSANTGLDNITRNLVRSTIPRLPPAPGFDGDQEFAEQVELWKRWIRWEKDDPLDLATEEPATLQKRILYTYRQALMALRFWPEMWVDAAEWCFESNIVQAGKDVGLSFLVDGIEANPESVLLALKHADRIETTYPAEEGDAAKIACGLAVKAPYSKLLDTLYGNIKNLKEREKAEIAKLRENMPEAPAQKSTDDDDYAPPDAPEDRLSDENQAKINAIEKGFAAQTDLLARTVSFVWIALARAMRRIQGKGTPSQPLGGLRNVFSEARHRGRLTSDVYVAVAQMEWTVYKDAAGAKIFERGAKLFPEDEYFMLEYIKFLHSRDDFINARVVFETCVNKLTQQPALVSKAKPLYLYFHEYESKFGELSQVAKLEKRMAEVFPEDPKLINFTRRFVSDRFDPIAARIIISPAAQLRPKNLIMPSIELSNAPGGRLGGSPVGGGMPGRAHSPRPQFVNSPKRPLPADDFDDSANAPPKKMPRGDRGGDRDFQRGESPLKGAAGRRLDQQRRLQGQGGSASHHNNASAAVPAIPRDVTFLLSQIPASDAYTNSANALRLNPARVVGLLRDTHIPDFATWRTRSDRPARHGGGGGHHRQVSNDVTAYADAQGRTGSPFGGDRGRLAYHQRPDSRDGYEPPPASVGYAAAPQHRSIYEAAVPPPPPGAWAPPPQGYAAPPPAPAQQQHPPSYGGYRY